MDELTEEEMEDMRQMDKRIKETSEDVEGVVDTPGEVKERDIDEMLDEYYKKHPKKAPLKHKIKKKYDEYKEQRDIEKQIYKEAYRKQKQKEIKRKGTIKARARHHYRPPYYSNMIGTPKQQPTTKKPKQKYIIKGGKAFPVHTPKKRYTPQKRKSISFDDNLFGGNRYKPIDTSKLLGSNLGFSSGGSKKKKKMRTPDPFDKLF